MKWDLALTICSLTYAPLKVMKGQDVAYFIVDHAIVEVIQGYVSLKPWKLYFDGSKKKKGIGIGIPITYPKEITTKFKFVITDC